MSPWPILGWMGVVFGALYFGRYGVQFARWIIESAPHWKKQLLIRTGLARCEWFDWRTAPPTWPHKVQATAHDGRLRCHCTQRATYRLTYGDLRCTEHKRSYHGSSVSQALPLRRAA